MSTGSILPDRNWKSNRRKETTTTARRLVFLFDVCQPATEPAARNEKGRENDRAPRCIDESMECNHPPTRNLIESFVDTCQSSKPVGKTAMFEMSWSGERRAAISRGKKHATRITYGILFRSFVSLCKYIVTMNQFAYRGHLTRENATTLWSLSLININ